jgi:hypothetical protein
MALEGDTNSTTNDQHLSHKDKSHIKFYEKIKDSKAKRRKKVTYP